MPALRTGKHVSALHQQVENMHMLSDLPTSVLCEVLRHFEAPELSALACTCRLYHRIVTQDLGEEYWRNLYRAQYPQYEAQARDPPRDWKTLYKDSFVKTKRIRQRALQRKVNELQNDIHDVNREIRTLNEEANDLINQERSNTSLYQEMDRGRTAEVALKTWSPVSVSVWHKQVVEQTPLDRTTRMEDLESKLKVTKLLLRSVLRRLETKKRKLSDLQDTLQSVNLKVT